MISRSARGRLHFGVSLQSEAFLALVDGHDFIRIQQRRVPTTSNRPSSTLQLWGIAVGLVISGEYFGWSYGWASAGTLGFTVTSLFIAAMYTAFIFSFTELTTSIPSAGGRLPMHVVPLAILVAISRAPRP